MTLAFSQELNGNPTYFVEKIVQGLMLNANNEDLLNTNKWAEIALADNYVLCDKWYEGKLHSKIHTIREDKSKRWKVGNKIHFVINNRTPKRYQFAPIYEVVAIQDIEIVWNNPQKMNFKSSSAIEVNDNFASVLIDGRLMSFPLVSKLARNDGFESVNDFFGWFNQDFNGKIIHWTHYRY